MTTEKAVKLKLKQLDKFLFGRLREVFLRGEAEIICHEVTKEIPL